MNSWINNKNKMGLTQTERTYIDEEGRETGLSEKTNVERN